MLARAGALIDLVAQPVYVWLFGLASFGLYAVLWATVNLIENIADLGMTGALQRTVPQATDDREAARALGTALVAGVLPCVAIAAMVSIFAPEVAPLFNVAARDAALLTGAIRLFAWALPLWAFVEIATSALRARRVFGAEIRLRIFWEQVIRLGLALALWPVFGTITALLVAHLASLAIVALLCVRLLARHYDLRALAGWHGETVRAGLAVLPAQAVARAFGDAPPIALNALLPGAAGATAGGLYVIARKLSSVVQLVRTGFAYVLAPLASAAARGGVEAVRPIYAFATRMAVALALPLGLVLAASADALLALYGAGAETARGALIVLILTRTAEAVIGAAQPVQQVIGSYRGQIGTSLIGLVVAAIAAALLVPASPITGMALAVSLGVLVAALAPLALLWRSGLDPFAPPFARAALIALAVGFAAAAIAVALPPRAWSPPAILPIALAALWASVRLALPADDRSTFGATGRRLGLTR